MIFSWLQCSIYSIVIDIIWAFLLSGGPLIRHSDSALIGVTSYAQVAKNRMDPVDGQIYTKIHYYFEWISMKTGIELPICNYPWPLAANFKY